MRAVLVATMMLTAAQQGMAMVPMPVCGDDAYWLRSYGDGVIAFGGARGVSWANCADRRAFVLASRHISSERQDKVDALFLEGVTSAERVTIGQLAERMRAAGVPVTDYRLAADACVCTPHALAQAYSGLN